ncbi:MAG: hypothetical protein AAF492_15740, partial [Verrucomicrobiota bacterium]
IDPVGGAGCPYLGAFAETLNIDLIPINGEPSGYLAREAEPRPRSAAQMASIIGPVGGDVGFILSSDMNRLSLVSELGQPVTEEYTFAVIANHILKKRTGTVVTNVCTTKTIDDIAAKHGAEVVKTQVGQAYVTSTLADEGGVLGGEGSGSVALREFGLCFDGFLMIGLVLKAMADADTTLSELIRDLPRYHIHKRAVPSDSIKAHRAMQSVMDEAATFQEARKDFTDGIRLDWDDGWVHVRTSRTQKLVRVISEATSRDAAERRANEVVRVIRRYS